MPEFDDFANKLEPKIGEVVKELNKVLMSIEPSFAGKKAWMGYGYKIGDNYSVVVAPYKDHVNLMIMRGIMLKDEHDVLEGSGVNTRHIKYFKPQDIKKDILVDLLDQQFKLYESGIRWE